MTEKKMIKKLCQNDIQALEKLITLYSSYVGAVIYGIIGRSMTDEDIEETAADVFAEVWKNPHKLTEGKVKQYLGAIARNMARNKLRELSGTVSIDENEYLLFDDSFETSIDRYEKSEIISDALSTLSESEREIFIRFYYYNQTSGTISAQLGIPVTNVTSCLSRGRKKMKSYLISKGFTV